jgi:hypothetical protein
MKAFIHNGHTYIRAIPSKFMMRSTMLYEMTTRGDILAIDTESQALVCIKGTEQVEHIELEVHNKSNFCLVNDLT